MLDFRGSEVADRIDGNEFMPSSLAARDADCAERRRCEADIVIAGRPKLAAVRQS